MISTVKGINPTSSPKCFPRDFDTETERPPAPRQTGAVRINIPGIKFSKPSHIPAHNHQIGTGREGRKNKVRVNDGWKNLPADPFGKPEFREGFTPNDPFHPIPEHAVLQVLYTSGIVGVIHTTNRDGEHIWTCNGRIAAKNVLGWRRV